MCNMFRRFPPNIARIARLLAELMAATAPLLVPPRAPAREHAFQLLKRHLVAPTSFSRPRAHETHVLDVEFERHVGGTHLREPEFGSLQLLVCLSRTLDNREKACGVTENECLAVLWTSLLLSAYLEGNFFLVRSLPITTL